MKACPPHTDWFSGAFDVTWPQDGVHFWQLSVNVCDHKLPKSASDVLILICLICLFFFNYLLSHIDDGARIPWFLTKCGVSFNPCCQRHLIENLDEKIRCDQC